MAIFQTAVSTFKEFVKFLCVGLAREERLIHSQPFTEYPIVLNVGDTLCCQGLSLVCTRPKLFRHEGELRAYLKPYLLLRSMKG